MEMQSNSRSTHSASIETEKEFKKEKTIIVNCITIFTWHIIQPQSKMKVWTLCSSHIEISLITILICLNISSYLSWMKFISFFFFFININSERHTFAEYSFAHLLHAVNAKQSIFFMLITDYKMKIHINYAETDWIYICIPLCIVHIFHLFFVRLRWLILHICHAQCDHNMFKWIFRRCGHVNPYESVKWRRLKLLLSTQNVLLLFIQSQLMYKMYKHPC